MIKKYILFFIALFLILNIVGCTKKVNITQEHDKIMNVAKKLIINDFDEHKLDITRKLIEESIKIHTITEIDDEIYILYSYNYNITESEEEFISDEFYEIGLNVIYKDSSKYGYKLMGGGGGGGDLQSTPITVHGIGNKLYGLIQDEKVSKLLLEYQDGEIISYDIEGKDYYLVIREDTEELIPCNITVLDKDNNIIFKFD